MIYYNLLYYNLLYYTILLRYYKLHYYCYDSDAGTRQGLARRSAASVSGQSRSHTARSRIQEDSTRFGVAESRDSRSREIRGVSPLKCTARLAQAPELSPVGDSNNTVRGYCLDIPRFEEPLNN